MSSEIVLYDLPSKDGKSSWSLNPWKTRMALNIKGLNYTTEWVEFPDVQEKLGSLGIPPNAEELHNKLPYTIPALKFDSKTTLMDSAVIIEELEKRYPTPELKIHSRYRKAAEDVIGPVCGPLAPLWLPGVPERVLGEESKAWFIEDREKDVGGSLEGFRDGFKEEKWDGVEKKMKDVAALLKENEGPFFEGQDVSYADVILVTMLYFFYRTNDEAFKRLMSVDKAIFDCYEACGKWFKHDS